MIISIGVYWLFCDSNTFNIYGGTYYKWIHYFSFMLQGCIIGVSAKQHPIVIRNGWIEMVKAIGCIIIFYGLSAFKNSTNLNYLQTFSLFPLLGVTYYIYRLCNSEWLKSIYPTKTGLIIRAIGGLCLEIYLVQPYLFTDKFNSIFPLNILVVFIEIILVAYILRCLSRVWSQTFKDNDYNWKEVFKIV